MAETLMDGLTVLLLKSFKLTYANCSEIIAVHSVYIVVVLCHNIVIVMHLYIMSGSAAELLEGQCFECEWRPTILEEHQDIATVVGGEVGEDAVVQDTSK